MKKHNENHSSLHELRPGLRSFSIITCLATLFLLFAGGMVTSTDSGLSVPGWPLSYGMLFPPMVGGVFYEHGHRMVATVVGALMLSLAVWMGFTERRRWLRNLGFISLGAVVLQGLLGGLTVLMMLPPPVSVAHAVLGQTFFVLTVIIAYSYSKERAQRVARPDDAGHYPVFLKANIILIALLYLQLIIAAIMRHTGSGLAIPDFPTMGGSWLPIFNHQVMASINHMRVNMGLGPVMLWQVVIHFLHRLMALILLVFIIALNLIARATYRKKQRVRQCLLIINGLIIGQILLGIAAVLTREGVFVTTVHVTVAAVILGMSVLMLFRAAPTSITEFKRLLTTRK